MKERGPDHQVETTRPSRLGQRRDARPVRTRRAVHVVPLVALWLLPVVAVAVAVPLTAGLDEASVAAPQPTTVTVGTREVDQAIAVSAVASLGARPEIRTAREGFVTELAEPGSIIVGSQVFSIDGVPVLAYQGPVLYRDLSRGSEGSDVGALSRYLVEVGFLGENSVADELGPDIEGGIERLQNSIGVDPDGVFRLSYVAYVPDTAIEITAPVAELGDHVAAGEPVLVADPPVESVIFEAVDQGGSLDVYAGAELTLRMGSEAVDVDGVELIGEEAHPVVAALDQGVRTGAVRADRIEGALTTYHGGVLALRVPLVSGVVPSTAVAVAPDGASCVIVVDGEADIADNREVALLTRADPANELGTVAVGESVIGREVVRDVSELSETERACE